jgi:hypothetical protein
VLSSLAPDDITVVTHSSSKSGDDPFNMIQIRKDHESGYSDPVTGLRIRPSSLLCIKEGIKRKIKFTEKFKSDIWIFSKQLILPLNI